MFSTGLWGPLAYIGAIAFNDQLATQVLRPLPLKLSVPFFLLPSVP
jgi:hypothetical protein